MKIVFLLTFVGALTSTFALSLMQPSCLYVQVKENFEPKKYFNGTWYLTNLQVAHLSQTDVCQESQSNVLEDGTISHKIFAYSDKRIPEFAVLNCTSRLSDIERNFGQVPLHCKVTYGNNVMEFDMEGRVMETDYDHFSVFYVCGRNYGNQMENVLILNRDKDGEPSDERIADTLKILDLDLKNFTSRKNANCKENPLIVNKQ